MPISASYFYPQVQVPNSSYPSVVMREVSASLVPGGTDLGKLYVAEDNSFHYVSEDGTDTEVVASGGGGGGVFSGDIVVSGNIEVLGFVFDGDSNLILSSAIGSVIAASGVLEFPLDADPNSAHIIATNAQLVLSSSGPGGSTVFISGTITGSSDALFQGRISTNDSFTVDSGLWNSAGMFIPAQDVFVMGGSSSTVFFFQMLASTTFNQHLIGVGTNVGRQIVFTSSSYMTLDHLHPTEDDVVLYLHSGRNPSAFPNDYMRFHFDSSGSQAEITSIGGPLVLSSSMGSQVVVSGNLKLGNTNRLILDDDEDSYLFAQSDDQIQLFVQGGSKVTWGPGQMTTNNYPIVVNGQSGQVTSATAHLVLSSSAGSVIAMSGTLKHDKVDEAALPAGTDSLSGSVLWVDDSKFLVVYGSEGWSRILTGSGI